MAAPADVSIPLNGNPADSTHILNIDPATIDSIINRIPDLTVPITGTNLRNLARSAVANLSPTGEIAYVAAGNCNDFDGITIEAANSKVTGTESVNVTIPVLNVGASVTAEMDVFGGAYSTEPCTINNMPGQRKLRKFFIRWYLVLNTEPGGAYRFTAQRYSHLVKVSDCCPIAADKPKPEEESGGW